MIMQEENLHSRGGEQTPSEGGGGHGTDNEAARLWAAIERSPTYSRMRKGILAGDDGHVRQVDVRRIGRQEVKNLVDRLVSTADEDNSRLLLRIRERMQR
jgi:hypothetical protein